MTAETVAIPSLTSALERGLRAQAEADSWGGEHLHCSDLGQALPDGCLRQVWLRIHGHPQAPADLGKRWLFARGNQIHETLTPILGAGLVEVGWRVVNREISLGDELFELFGIERGTMDVLLEHREHRACLVTDYKSIKPGGLARLSSPKEDNVLQLQGYLEATDLWLQRLNGKIPWTLLGGVLVYADRGGSGGFKEFFVRRDRAAVEAAARKLVALREMKEPPPGARPQGKNQSWRCQYTTRDGETVRCPYLGISCPGSLALAAEPQGSGAEVVEVDFGLMTALRASLKASPKKGAGK